MVPPTKGRGGSTCVKGDARFDDSPDLAAIDERSEVNARFDDSPDLAVVDERSEVNARFDDSPDVAAIDERSGEERRTPLPRDVPPSKTGWESCPCTVR